MAAAPTRHPNEVLAVLLLSGTAFALSQTVVVPALPEIAGELHASPSAVSWILTGYLLSASVATPVAGKLGDLYGKGRVLTWVMLIFSAGSVVCALAPSIGVVIAGRAVQGVAGGVFPLSFGIIRDTFPRERMAAGIGIMSAIFGVGGGIGLPLSGVMVEHLDVSWLFWIGLVAVPAALAAQRVVPPSPTARRARVDWAGALLLSCALVAILVAVTEAEDWGWGSARTLALLAGGVALLGAWLALEGAREQPLIELRVLRRRAVAATNLTGFMVGFAMFSSFLLIPRFAEAPERTGYGFGMSVLQSGLLIAPAAVVQLLMGPVAGRLGMRIGFRAVLAIGAGMLVAAFGLLAVAHGRPWQFVVAAGFLGGGITFALASMAILIVVAVPQADVGIATGINTITRTVGGAFGAAAATAILAADTVGRFPTDGAYTVAFAASAGGGLLALGAALLVRTAGGDPAPEPLKAEA